MAIGVDTGDPAIDTIMGITSPISVSAVHLRASPMAKLIAQINLHKMSADSYPPSSQGELEKPDNYGNFILSL